MKDPEQLYRNAYFQALTGKVLIGGVVVPVYQQSVPSTELPPYICLDDVTTSRRDAAAGCVEWDCTMLVDIVAKYDNNKLKASDVVAAGAKVLELIDTINITTGFKIATTDLEQSRTLTETDSANVISRRLLRFRNTLYEL